MSEQSYSLECLSKLSCLINNVNQDGLETVTKYLEETAKTIDKMMKYKKCGCSKCEDKIKHLSKPKMCEYKPKCIELEGVCEGEQYEALIQSLNTSIQNNVTMVQQTSLLIQEAYIQLFECLTEKCVKVAETN